MSSRSLIIPAFTLLFSAILIPSFAQNIQASVPSIEKQSVREIKKLIEKTIVEKAMQSIMDMDAETISNQVMLTEIASPPFKESIRSVKFAELIKATGIDSVWTDLAGNVIALHKGKLGNKRIVIEGHMDTVFPEGTNVKVRNIRDTLFAPGVGDDTRALAMLITIAKALVLTHIETDADILFIGTTGEEGEGDLKGVKNLFSRSGPGKIDSYISIDGKYNDEIISRALGSHRYRITFRGPGGHSSSAFGTANPHNALGHAIHYWSIDAEKYLQSPGAGITYNVSIIGGGTSVNAISAESWMDVDMRSEDPKRLAGIDSLLSAAVRRALIEENNRKKIGRNLIVETKLIGDRPTGECDPSSPLIQRAIAISNHFGIKPKLIAGSSNSNIPISRGIPAITITRGGKTGNGHALNEYFINDKGYIALQQAMLLLLAEAGISN